MITQKIGRQIIINSPEIKISVNRFTGKIGMVVDFIIIP
jgi:hypothetical protein